MIEINLLPEDKRSQKRAAAAKTAANPAAVSETLKKLVYVVPVAAGVLLIVHAYLAFAQVSASMSVGALEKQLQTFQPQMTDIRGFKTRFESVSQDEKMIAELARGNLNWSKKLNRLSLDLPPGVWINDLTCGPRQLVLRCSVVSLDTDLVELINRFLVALKDDPDFFADFANFDLGSVQKHPVGSYEVADFTVTMEVRPR